MREKGRIDTPKGSYYKKTENTLKVKAVYLRHIMGKQDIVLQKEIKRKIFFLAESFTYDI